MGAHAGAASLLALGLGEISLRFLDVALFVGGIHLGLGQLDLPIGHLLFELGQLLFVVRLALAIGGADGLELCPPIGSPAA